MAFQRRQQVRIREPEIQHHLATRMGAFNPCGKPLGNDKSVIRPQAPGGFSEGPPAAKADGFKQGKFETSLTASPITPNISPHLAPSFELQRQDPGIVEDQEIPGPQQIGQIADAPITMTLGIQMQQAGTIPRSRRTQGNRLVRQGEVEKVHVHS